MWIICLSQMNQRWIKEQNANHTTLSHTQDPHTTYLLSTPSSLLMLSKHERREVALPHSSLCRLHRYIGYFIEDTQTSESVSTSRSAISKAALT